MLTCFNLISSQKFYQSKNYHMICFRKYENVQLLMFVLNYKSFTWEVKFIITCRLITYKNQSKRWSESINERFKTANFKHCIIRESQKIFINSSCACSCERMNHFSRKHLFKNFLYCD